MIFQENVHPGVLYLFYSLSKVDIVGLKLAVFRIHIILIWIRIRIRGFVSVVMDPDPDPDTDPDPDPR